MSPAPFSRIPPFGSSRIPAVALVAAAGLGLALLAPHVAAAPEQQRAVEDRPRITVIGEGEVRAEPDLAVVTVGATSIAPTSQAAMDEVSVRLADVIASAKALGVEDRDVQTTGLALQPIMRPQPRGDDSPPEIEAYRASNNVTLTVRDIGRASPVLDAATRSGANVVGGLRFGFSHLDELRLRALEAATSEAGRKARTIAAAAGLTITAVISISEDGVDAPRPAAADTLRALPAAVTAPPPVERGELIVRARVRASYAI